MVSHTFLVISSFKYMQLLWILCECVNFDHVVQCHYNSVYGKSKIKYCKIKAKIIHIKTLIKCEFKFELLL